MYGGKVASDLQTDVIIANGKVTGTLKFIEGGLAPSGYLAGDGYFMAITWSEPAEDITSLKVGLQPSIESGMVEGITDPDRTFVAKVTPSLNQKLVLMQTSEDGTRTQYFDLDLEFDDTEG